MDDYTPNDLTRDLALMVRAGLLEMHIREDGEWVYSISAKAAAMTEEEREEAIRQMAYDEDDDDIVDMF